MTDSIFYTESNVTNWMDAIGDTFAGAKLQAAKDNTTLSRTVSTYTGSNITLSSTTGLYVGSRIYFTLLSGTAPPELNLDYTYVIATITGNVITIHSSHDPPTAVVVLSVSTCSLTVTERPLSVLFPKAAWDYHRLQLRQSSVNVNTIPIAVARSWYSDQQTVELTTGAFTRGTTSTNPIVVYAWLLLSSTDDIIGAIKLDPTITITSTQVVTFYHAILSQPVEL